MHEQIPPRSISSHCNPRSSVLIAASKPASTFLFMFLFTGVSVRSYLQFAQNYTEISIPFSRKYTEIRLHCILIALLVEGSRNE